MSSHVITRRITRRATSVPVEPISVIETNGASTARRISTAALDDTDAIMNHSKRHDRQLIDEINARMAIQSLPVGVVKRTKTTLRRPPLPPSLRSVSGSTTLSSRRFTSGDLDNDDDVTIRMPPTPITRSVIRASSVPPISQVRTQQLHHQYVPVTSTRIASYYQPAAVNGYLSSVTSPYWTNYDLANNEHVDDVKLGYVPTRVTGPPGQVSPVADFAIRQAHRNLDRIERELKHAVPSESSNSDRYFQTQLHANQTRAPVRVTRNPAVTSVRYRRASVSPVSSYHHHLRASSPVRPSELISFAPKSSAKPSSGAGFEHRKVATSAKADYEPRLYRSQSQQPISPLYVIAGSGSGDKRKESAKRYIDSVAYSLSHPPEKPKISDARRKVRDVLCKVKKDPHYFD